ncbi:hypothetical protein AB733_06595 [Photobacterium swingsii]|uniref:Inovirus Gp2 family protein n=1 Tax=Photobacterium swingsii TaxID=680026 RepID=A0A0J8VCL2_9GAMM|nr:inovirus Gp2 family protein [Photobacterium swingsii]KMV31193.1 hypothetical protein AB733_06595 [Photobacterium swingsii]PSW24184.1 inovirus Gp2 family protein [Photobacterium swingsii]
MRKKVFKNLRIVYPLGKLEQRYLIKLKKVLDTSLESYPRVFAIRLDLRFPDPQRVLCNDIIYSDINNIAFDEDYDVPLSSSNNCSNIMKRFIDSLKAKLVAKERSKKKVGVRVHPNTLRFAWCRERKNSENDHFHIVLFFNKDAYHRLGHARYPRSLASLIIDAWASALKYRHVGSDGLVHFSKNHSYYVNKRSIDFTKEYNDLFHRISYLAKKETKHYGEGYRCFGCSTR